MKDDSDDRRKNLQVIDTTDKITTEDVKQIKQIVDFWQAGKIVVVVIVGLGAAASAGMYIWDLFSKLFERAH